LTKGKCLKSIRPVSLSQLQAGRPDFNLNIADILAENSPKGNVFPLIWSREIDILVGAGKLLCLCPVKGKKKD